MSRHTVRTLALASALVVLASAPAVRARSSETFEWSRDLPAGAVLEIKNVNGGIVASGGAGTAVEAVKSGREDDPGEVRIEVVESTTSDGHPRVTLCAVYPGERNRCAPGDEGNLGARDNDVAVAFRVRVAPGVRLVARSINGAVEATELEDDVDASTVNGAIAVRTAGRVSATTVNGSIEAVVGARTWDGAIRLETVNGSIRLSAPADLSARIEASTQNGSIDTDWPLEVHGKWVGRHVDGEVGEGGPGTLKARTVNGRIELRHP